MGIASIAARFLESGPTIEGNDERLAMIRQALETEGGRGVTAGPRLTGADSLRPRRPASRPAAVSERLRGQRRADRRRAALRLDPTTSCRPDRTNDAMQFHMLRPRS